MPGQAALTFQPVCKRGRSSRRSTSMKFKFRTVLVTGLAALGAGLAPGVARADHDGLLRDHCVGSKLAQHNILGQNGVLLGHTELWYSPINGGQNCVMTYNRGGSPYTEAHIRRLIDDSTGWRVSSNDTGYYQYYAGGSYINNTDNHCITWGGSISGYGWYSNQNGVFCD